MIMQSYDFLMLYQKYGCTLQFGGDDQWSNMLGGTELIRRKLGKDASAMTITLLLNSEGKKMGKTQKGAVWLDPEKTTPYEFYQYWRNVDDADVLKCLRLLTFLSIEEIEAMKEDGTFDVLPKKEVIGLNKELEKLTKNLGGIKEMKRLPDAIFIVDPKKERICVQEARALGITLIGIADTNCDPDELDYVIPGNDDAIRAVKLIVAKMADAVIEANQGEENAPADVAFEETEETVEA